MTDDLYLIAHKVRGAPAFDIAQHMTCPACEGTDDGCIACDGAGHWWIIPTSGHRAFPYWSDELRLCIDWPMQSIRGNELPIMPPDLRDHYTSEAEAALDLTKALGLTAAPLPPILRRF